MLLLLPIVGSPSTAIVTPITSAAKATVLLAISTCLLMASSSLMSKTAETAVLVSLTLVQVTWITTEALLVQLLGSLSSSRSVRRGTWSSRLSTERRWAGSTALRVGERLQRILVGSLLAALLSIRGVLIRITSLGSSKSVRESAAKSTSTSRGRVLRLRS